jgi:cytochrome P450
MTAQAQPAPFPAHVPPDRIVDFDVYRDNWFAGSGDLHLGLHELAQKVGRGIFWTPHNGGHWFINDYELTAEAARRTDLFSSTAMTIPPVPEEPRLIPLFLDPPIHMAYRIPLMMEFAPSKMRAMEDSIRDFARSLIDAFARDGECDFVEAIAEPLPIIIFMRLMGMPEERLHEFRGWIFDMLSDDNERRPAAYARIAEMMDGLIREREKAPRGDLISRLLALEIDGRPITYDEIQGYCLLLFAAGLDTVANALSFGMNHVASDLLLQERLRNDRSLVPDAVEEILRKFGVPMPARTATHDFEYGGVTIRQGERVMLMLPAANLDPKVFPDPLRFDIDRPNKGHLGFNIGPHTCLGAHLARLELKIFWDEWFRAMPEVRHNPDRRIVLRSGLTLAIQQLPLVWDRAEVGARRTAKEA